MYPMMTIEEFPLDHEAGRDERRLESELTPEEHQSLSLHALNFQKVLSPLYRRGVDYNEAHRFACADWGIISAEEEKMRTLNPESSQ